jgi:hypothetical protein
MISRSIAAFLAVPLGFVAVAACNASSNPPKVQASVLLQNDSPWPGTLQLTRGFAGNLSTTSNDVSCVAIDTVPQDTALGTATILIPGTPRVRTFTWSFRTTPFLSVQLSGDSAGGVNVSRVGFSNDAAPCIP